MVLRFRNQNTGRPCKLFVCDSVSPGEGRLIVLSGEMVCALICKQIGKRDDVKVSSGPEPRRRWTTAEKVRIVEERLRAPLRQNSKL